MSFGQGALTFCLPGTTSCSSYINPLSPNSDQHEFSPNNIHMLPLREIVMRVNKMSIIEKMLICHQSLSTNSSKKCMKISMEKLYVDIGA